MSLASIWVCRAQELSTPNRCIAEICSTSFGYTTECMGSSVVTPRPSSVTELAVPVSYVYGYTYDTAGSSTALLYCMLHVATTRWCKFHLNQLGSDQYTRSSTFICMVLLSLKQQLKVSLTAKLRGVPDDTWGAMVFSPVQFFFFAPNQKQAFVSSQAKEQAYFFPHITPFFCQFCEQTFIFYSLLNKVFFSSLFAEQSFSQKKPPRPLPCRPLSSGQPLNSSQRSIVISGFNSKPKQNEQYRVSYNNYNLSLPS